jgi:hypothetical protein
MRKSDERRTGECRPANNQTMPRGHFDREGLSQGKQEGAVRKSWDAEQGPRPAGEQRK